MAKNKNASMEKSKLFAQEVDAAAAETSNFFDLWNRITGIGGTMQRIFPDRAERSAFMLTDEWKRYQQLIDERMGDSQEQMMRGMPDVSGTLSLRLPRSLHAALRAEAEEEGVSINQLCVAKLSLQLRTATTV